MTDSTVFLPLVSTGDKKKQIRIGTQNLGFEQMERASTLAGSIAKDNNLDVFAMQEVYRWPHRAEGHEPKLVENIRASLPGWHIHEGPSDTWMINVTASRHPIVKSETIQIEERHLLATTVRTPSGDITVFNWHAKRDNDGKQHACRYNRKALDYIRANYTGEPFVLVGDLNATIDRLWGECNVGADSTLQRRPDGYDGSDVNVGVWGPKVVKIERLGNTHNIIDAHNLTVATVEL